MKTLHKYLAIVALALAPSWNALAQDVAFSLTSPTSLSGDKATCTDGIITVNYVMATGNKGAYMDGYFSQIYNMVISSTKPVAVIEFDGYPHPTNAAKTIDFTSTAGKIHMHVDEPSVWQDGPSSSFTIKGASSTSYFIFTAMRVWYEGTPYGKQYVADPTIACAGGKVTFASTTPGATFSYNMQLTTDGKLRMCNGTVPLDMPLVVKVKGEAKDCEASSVVEQTIPFASLYGSQGDADGDGRLNIFDLQTVIDNILKKTVK